MKKICLAVLALAVVTLTSCGSKPSQPPAAGSSNLTPVVSLKPAASEPLGPECLNGTWERWDADYRPPAEKNLFDVIVKLPDYNGMDEAAFYDWAKEQGFDGETGPSVHWAENVKFGDPRYAAYISNKDCVSSTNYDGRSVFVLDFPANEEWVLLSGSDGNAYSPVVWLYTDALLCRRDGEGTKASFCLCDPDGGIVWLEGLFESDRGLIGYNGLLLAEEAGQELRLVRAGRDGSVTELARAAFDGTCVNDCAISDDGSYVCYILQKDLNDSVVIWNTETGQMIELEPPQMEAGKEIIEAVDVDYIWAVFEVVFQVRDASSPDGHLERWCYSSDAWAIPVSFDREF